MQSKSGTSGNRGGSAVPKANSSNILTTQRSLLRGTRLRELDREFNRQTKQLASLAKKLKSKVTPKSEKV